MRARSIKPSLLGNEILGTADPLCTLLFEALWMMADREGRLEDRPLRIKAQAFPYRSGVDVEALLQWLDEQDFIIRYVVGSQGFIQVAKFAEHQRPHPNEKASVIPACDQGTPRRITKETSADDQGAKHFVLTPSSLTPSSLTPDSPLTRIAEMDDLEQTQWFLDFKAGYPNRAGNQGWPKARRAARARLNEGHTPTEFLEGARRYAEFVRSQHNWNTSFVMMASTFLGPDKPFLQEWQPAATRADNRLGSNIDVARQFVEGETS